MKVIEANVELAKAAKDAAAGIVDTMLAEEACRRMDEAREKLRQRTGELDIAVELIREAREE